MKKLLILALLIVGCSFNTVSNVSSLLIGIFIIDKDCKKFIYRYNELQDEKKKLVLKYEQLKKNNDLSDEIKHDNEDRILDLSFQIDDIHQQWIYCNGGKQTTNFN